MAVSIPHKRGDTFLHNGAVTQLISDVVTPVDISAYTIRCQIRKQGQTLPVAEVEVTITDGPAGEYELRVDDTTAWPVVDLLGDIEYVLPSGQIISTETFTVAMVQDQTLPVTP